MASSLITSWQIEEENVEAVTHFLFLGSKITADGDCSHAIRRQFLPSRKSMTNLDSALKSKHYFADRGPYSQGYGLSSSHVWMWELDSKEGRVLRSWCFWTMVLEKTLESPFESKEIKPVKIKVNQSWIPFGRTDAEAEPPIIWPPDAKNWLSEKDTDAGKNSRSKEKAAEDEMVR